MNGKDIKNLVVGLCNLTFDSFIHIYETPESAINLSESRLSYLRGKYKESQTKTLRWISELDFYHLDRLAEVLFCALNPDQNPTCWLVRQYGHPADLDVTTSEPNDTFDMFWCGNRSWQVMKDAKETDIAFEI